MARSQVSPPRTRTGPALSGSGGSSTWPPVVMCWTTICTPPQVGSAEVVPAFTWLVGSAEDVAKSLRAYADLGITHFVLSDTPYLREIERQGDTLLPLLRA